MFHLCSIFEISKKWNKNGTGLLLKMTHEWKNNVITVYNIQSERIQFDVHSVYCIQPLCFFICWSLIDEQGGGAVMIRPPGGSGTFISCSWSGNSALWVSDMFQIFSPFNNFLNNIIIVKFNLQNILSIYCLNFTMTF